ncbi:MAG: hypothetical protein NVSMB29_01030 [Candidatus Dormibacteria bacterium]
MAAGDDPPEQLDDRERTRLSRRDRRRSTRMVVDNAAVKRVQLALEERRSRERAEREGAADRH